MDISGEAPIEPIYPFNAPGQPILLYSGPIGGVVNDKQNGSVELSFAPKPRINWHIDAADSFFGFREDCLSLILDRKNGQAILPAWMRGNGDGWSNGGEFGSREAPLKRIVAHWVNVPNWHGPVNLMRSTNEGQQAWSGRWIFEADVWRITFDVRPDHSQVWRNLHQSQVFVMTHVMELCRADGGYFTATEAEPVLSALHMGISFALGRFVAPMLPVGQDAEGKTVWEAWGPSLCDPARRVGSGWWFDQDLRSLEDLLRKVIYEFSDPDRRAQLQLQLRFAISGTKDEGFVEQRITIGAAGLEHLVWQELVLKGRMSKRQYGGAALFNGVKLYAHSRLRLLLEDAQISLTVDDDLLPVASKYVAEKRILGEILDGADVVTRIRNQLVHPQGSQEEVYRLEKLVSDVWRMTCHYLSLLILHSIDYRGSTRNMMKVNGWVGDVERVPWAPAE